MGSRCKTSGLIQFTAAALSLGIATGVQAECREDRVSLRGKWGSAYFNVEIADDADERAVGLMNRESMPQSAGMLFVHDTPMHATFWMRNTLIPLDIVFVDATGVVTHIHENAVPMDETVIDGGRNVLAVLEINGGLSSALGLSVGSELRHPALDAGVAAWPCENF